MDYKVTYKPMTYKQWLKKPQTKKVLKILFADLREFNSKQLKLF